MTRFGINLPRQPDDSENPAGDALDEIDEAVARITDEDIEMRLNQTLRREGYAAGQDMAASSPSTPPGGPGEVLADASACTQAQEPTETTGWSRWCNSASTAREEATAKASSPVTSPSTVTAEVRLALVVPQQVRVPLITGLYYSASDPYAVRFAFHIGLDEPVEWTIARDLLVIGTEDCSGFGDIRIWPDGSADGHRMLNIELTSPFGQALFEVRASDIAEFLARTYLLVPAGTEASRIDIDAELTSLCGPDGAWRDPNGR